eukprot:SAG22_NODE_2208_length_2835_cov_4.717836_2_plen_300_part_00
MLMKVVYPTALITMLSFLQFFFAVDSLAERLAYTVTCFLSTFAMLYVAGGSLPKGLGATTIIDKSIMLTTFTIVAEGLTSCLIHQLDQCGDVLCNRTDVETLSSAEAAATWNRIACTGLFALNLIANLAVFVPAYLRRKNLKRALSDGNLTGEEEHYYGAGYCSSEDEDDLTAIGEHQQNPINVLAQKKKKRSDGLEINKPFYIPRKMMETYGQLVYRRHKLTVETTSDSDGDRTIDSYATWEEFKTKRKRQAMRRGKHNGRGIEEDWDNTAAKDVETESKYYDRALVEKYKSEKKERN